MDILRFAAWCEDLFAESWARAQGPLMLAADGLAAVTAAVLIQHERLKELL